GGVAGPVDVLMYEYWGSGNQLRRVSDNAVNRDDGVKDGDNTGDDYDYDDNGNLVFDLNKGIDEISYNHLNLPVEVSFLMPGPSGVKHIRYEYSAAGTKLRQSYFDHNEQELFSLQYIGEFVAVNSV